MADLPQLIKSIDELPEPVRPVLKDFYVPGTGELEGQLVLSTGLQAVEKLQGALNHERGQRSGATGELAKHQTRIQELEAELAKRTKEPTSTATGDPTLRQQIENLKQTSNDRIKALEDQLKAERETRVQAEADAHETKLMNDLRKGALEAGASEKTADDLVARMMQYVWEDDDGTKFFPAKEDGTPLLSKGKDPTAPMSWRELGELILADATHLKRGSIGGNATGGAQTPGGMNGQFVLTKTQARDPQLYRAKRAEAMKAGQELVIVDDQTL